MLGEEHLSVELTTSARRRKCHCGIARARRGTSHHGTAHFLLGQRELVRNSCEAFSKEQRCLVTKQVDLARCLTDYYRKIYSDSAFFFPNNIFTL